MAFTVQLTLTKKTQPGATLLLRTALGLEFGPRAKMLALQPTTERLLQPDELIPHAVQRTIRFLDAHGVSGRLSRNPVVHGCKDAASKRWRNGKRGIDLADELKSLAGSYVTAGCSERVFLCHIPADCRFDIRKIRVALGASRRPTRLSPAGCECLGIGFGRVNPFSEGIMHIFDESLLGREGTMMTNAGDRTWAVEFSPADLIRSIREAIISDVVKLHAAMNQNDDELSSHENEREGKYQ